MPAGNVTVMATVTIPTVTTSYVDASGTLHENIQAIPLDETMTTLAAGTYVVNSDIVFNNSVLANNPDICQKRSITFHYQ